MTLRTITFDDEQWQLVPRRLPEAMIDTINGHIDADSDAVALWRDALIDAPETSAQQPTRDLLAEATEQVEALERENHRMRRCVARLMARLTVWLDDDQFNEADGIMYPEFKPPAQQPSMEAAIAAGDGTLHGAIDHWQERALAAEAKLAAQQPMTEGQMCSMLHTLDLPPLARNAMQVMRWKDGVDIEFPRHSMVRIVRAVEAHHGIDKGEGGDRIRKQQPMTDEQMQEVFEEAARMYRRHKSSVRGQMLVPQDATDYWLVRAVERHHSIGKGESNAG